MDRIVIRIRAPFAGMAHILITLTVELLDAPTKSGLCFMTFKHSHSWHQPTRNSIGQPLQIGGQIEIVLRPLFGEELLQLSQFLGFRGSEILFLERIRADVE
jgi:hypothetical protein